MSLPGLDHKNFPWANFQAAFLLVHVKLKKIHGDLGDHVLKMAELQYGRCLGPAVWRRANGDT